MDLYAIDLPAAPLPDTVQQALLAYLKPDAGDRLQRFRLPEDALRSLVGQLAPVYCLLDNKVIDKTTRLKFDKKGKGKPYLLEPDLAPALAFNTSHEGSYVLLGILRGEDPEIGVDLMRVPSNPLEIQEGISEQLTLLEKQVLAGVPSEEQRSRLITLLWTFKEGYVKATGDGIGFGLDRIEVDINLDTFCVESIAVDGVNVEDDGWRCSSGWIGESPEQYGWTVFWKGDNSPKIDVGIRHIPWNDFIAPFIDTEDVQR